MGRSQEPTVDVAILGAGPAGLALAAHCAARGMTTSVFAPGYASPWPQSYGIFAEQSGIVDVPRLELDGVIRSRHPRPLVAAGDGAWIDVGVTYLRFDTARLQFGLLDAVKALGVRLIDGAATAVERDRGAATAVERDRGAATRVVGAGVELLAHRVFDATGSTSRWATRSRPRPLGYQSAYGAWFSVDALPCAPREMWLMDYRGLGAETPPSFLYAIPEGENLLFAQETVLASQLPVDMDVLARRLESRMQRLGLRVLERRGEERCIIPLGVGLPPRGGSPIPFGAAAGFVNPVSGYQLARAFGAADRVAQAVAARGTEAAIYDALWPKPERDAYRLYHVALAQMLRLPAHEFRDFIAHFFELPRPLWLGFITGTQEPREVAATMWRLFRRAPTALQLRLVRAAASCGADALGALAKEASP